MSAMPCVKPVFEVNIQKLLRTPPLGRGKRKETKGKRKQNEPGNKQSLALAHVL